MPPSPSSSAAILEDTAKAVGRRERLLDETARFLVQHGIARTSMVEIARQAGVSRAAIYYYFNDLQDLVFQSYERTCALMAHELANARAAGGSALAIIQRFVNSLVGSQKSVLAPVTEVAFLHPDQQGAIVRDYANLLDGIAEIVDAGIAAGSIRKCAPRIAGQAVLGVVSWAPLAWRWSTIAGLSHADLVAALDEMLRSGIARRPYHQRGRGPICISPISFSAAQAFDPAALTAARQEALMAAASWLFNQKGIDATSLDEIAQRLQVTKKVISHNFGDKAALVADCYRRSFGIFLDIAERATIFDGTAVEAAWAAAYALAEVSVREDIAPLAPLTGIEALAPELQDELQASALKLTNAYLALHHRGKADGSLAAINSQAAVVMHPGYFEWLPKWLGLFSDQERTLMPRELADLYILGLAPDPVID